MQRTFVCSARICFSVFFVKAKEKGSSDRLNESERKIGDALKKTVIGC